MPIRKYGSGEIIETTQVPDRRVDEEQEDKGSSEDEVEERTDQD
jgi:hypothetical protein